MSLITPGFGLLFWMTVVFLVVLFVLWKWGFPVIVKMELDRKDYIDSSLKKAHEANERLANIQKEGESILQEAREKQALILKEAARCESYHRTGEESRYCRHPKASRYAECRDCREGSP